MTWQIAWWSWLVHSAVSGAVILGVGVIAARLCREPVYRIALIGWALVGCLVVPAVQLSGLVPQSSLSVLPVAASGLRTSEKTESNGAEMSSVAVPYGAMAATEPRPPEVTAADDAQVADWLPVTAAPDTPDESAAGVVPFYRLPQTGAGDPRGFAVLKWIGWSYVAIVGWLVFRRGVGAMKLSQLRRCAQDASLDVVELFRSIAGPDGGQTQLLVSDSIDSPITWGLMRPVIVLPASLVRNLQVPILRWNLAHEWSHVRRRDVAVHWIAGLVRLLCFYQPGYWWLRRQLLLSQDYLADAFAARHGGSSEEYAAFLVALAKARVQPACAGTLGIADRPSNLFCRVNMLVQSPRPLVQQVRAAPAAMISAVAIVAMALLCAIRLDAADAATKETGGRKQSSVIEKDDSDKPAAGQPAQEQPAGESKPEESKRPQLKEPADEKPLPDPITYTGKVVDRMSGAPIGGVKVEIIRSLNRDPKTGEWVKLETTTHETNADGEYSFTLPPEQVAEGSLYLEVDAHHPDYLSKGRSGYAHSMILKNLKLGEPPFYSLIKLSPGKRIWAVAHSPDGKPLAGVPVVGYSKAPSNEPGLSFELGAFIKTKTDESGRFELTVATPGAGVFWLFPEEYSPQAHVIPEERGDMGTLTVVEGPRLSGTVLNALSEPVPNVWVNGRRDGDGEAVDQFLGQNAVANQIGRSTLTDEAGRFQFNPLPAGDYRLEISERSQDPSKWDNREKVPVADVFSAMTVTLTEGVTPPPIEYRASPHVIIRGRFFNSQGEPRASHEQHLFGKSGKEYFFAQSTRPMNDGWFEFKVPHGLQQVKLNLMTNEHSALRWRKNAEEELQYGREIDLGTVEADIDTIEIVRYTAPILLVKAVDEAGNAVDSFKPEFTYTEEPSGGRRLRATIGGDLSCEHQPDGRWRTSQLLPDEQVTVTVAKEGFTSDPQTVSLEEAETRELTFTLRKAD